MKYFVVGDVHGCAELLKEALDKAGFDPTNLDHTLISLGDAMDRGPWNIECLQYFNSLPRKILIRGNHEDLFEALCKKDFPESHDKSNGTVKTVEQLANAYCEAHKIPKVPYMSHKYFKTAGVFASKNDDWVAYKNQLVDYFETEHYIFVHGWIPTLAYYQGRDHFGHNRYAHFPIEAWRECGKKAWDDARWTNSVEAYGQHMTVEGKTIVCGHWTTSDFHEKFEGAEKYTDFSIFKGDGVIAIDGMVNYSDRMNVLVVED